MKPILFNTEMVRAILDGRKTQTRRVVSGENNQILLKNLFNNYDDYSYDSFMESEVKYKIGDILYVRETWAYVCCCCQTPWCCDNKIYYKADGEEQEFERCTTSWKPSIHMPKQYARIFLKIKNVRVERLQDITRLDVWNEGIRIPCVGASLPMELYDKWKELWNSTSKDGYKWEDNPYVFVYEFERVEK